MGRRTTCRRLASATFQCGLALAISLVVFGVLLTAGGFGRSDENQDILYALACFAAAAIVFGAATLIAELLRSEARDIRDR